MSVLNCDILLDNIKRIHFIGIGGNSYVGQSDIIVCEACEYVDTFLQLNPFISIILNIDADHLDYFKNLDNIKKSFNKFAKQTTGLLVINGDDQNTLDAVNDVDIEKITYGFGENCDYRAENISADKGVHPPIIADGSKPLPISTCESMAVVVVLP